MLQFKIRDRTKTGFVSTSGIWPLRGGGGVDEIRQCVTNSTLHFHEQENTNNKPRPKAFEKVCKCSGIKKEIETIVKLRVNRVINNMNLVKRDEFEILKKLVQKLVIENKKLLYR